MYNKDKEQFTGTWPLRSCVPPCNFFGAWCHSVRNTSKRPGFDISGNLRLVGNKQGFQSSLTIYESKVNTKACLPELLLGPLLKFGLNPSFWFCRFPMRPQPAWLRAAATSAGFMGSAPRFRPRPSGLQFWGWLPCWPWPVIPTKRFVASHSKLTLDLLTTKIGSWHNIF